MARSLTRLEIGSFKDDGLQPGPTAALGKLAGSKMVTLTDQDGFLWKDLVLIPETDVYIGEDGRKRVRPVGHHAQSTTHKVGEEGLLPGHDDDHLGHMIELLSRKAS